MQSRAIYTDINYLQGKIENENDFHLWAHLVLSSVTPILFVKSLPIYVLIHTVNSLQDGHLWDRHKVTVLERCPSYRESNKGSKESQGPTLSVRLIEVSVKRESTVFRLN